MGISNPALWRCCKDTSESAPKYKYPLSLAIATFPANLEFPAVSTPPKEPVEVDYPLITELAPLESISPSPVTSIEPDIPNEPVTLAVEVVYSMCVPPAETLI